MKEFNYNQPIAKVSQMKDAIDYTDENKHEIVKIKEPNRTRFTMAGEPNKKGHHHYISGTEEDLKELYKDEINAQTK